MDTEEKNEIEGVVVAQRKLLELETKDEDLVGAINSAIAESVPLKEKIDKEGKRAEQYWQDGTSADLSQVHPKKAKIVNNRIFMSIETIIPILTSETPEPTIVGELDNATREKLNKVLKIAYEVKYKLQQKLQRITRHWALYKLGVWKYRWDDGFITENVLTEKIGVDPRATDLENCEFMFELMEDKASDLVEKYPEKKTEITEKVGGEENLKSKIKYYEFWGGGGEWVAWKMGDIIIDKKKNPNFDYEDDENNLFKKPRFPYLLLNVFQLGRTLFDSTSLIDQSIPLQDGISKLENQIIDLNEGLKRVWAASAEAMSYEQFQDLVNRTGDLGVYYDRKTPAGGIQLPLAGRPDTAIFNHLAHLIGQVDNIMGTHATTRGERSGQETLGGRKILMGADLGRLDLIIRNVEQLMEDWFNAYLHMIKVYSLEDTEFNNGEETVRLSKEEIPKGILVKVKKGSLLPTDKASRAEMAIKLAQFDKIDPESLFSELGYGHEVERTEKLFEWLRKTGKIQPEQPGQAGAEDPRLARLKQQIESPEFQQLPPEEQQEIIGRAREIVEAIKQGQ